MTKVKICGLKDEATVLHTAAAGADFIGFVFAESRRKVTPEAVAKMTQKLPPAVKKVGVFVSPTVAELKEVLQRANLDLLQIHGVLPDISTLKVPVIQAVDVTIGLPASGQSEYLLLDAPAKEFVGGNGETFEWQKVDPKKIVRPLFVAGGLNAENVKAACQYFQPFAVDVSSGVETNGQKDFAKITAFIKAVKEENNV